MADTQTLKLDWNWEVMSSVAAFRRASGQSRDTRLVVCSFIFVVVWVAVTASALYVLLTQVTEDKVKTALYSFEHSPTQSDDGFRR